jgi:hypothetical protein
MKIAILQETNGWGVSGLKSDTSQLILPRRVVVINSGWWK